LDAEELEPPLLLDRARKKCLVLVVFLRKQSSSASSNRILPHLVWKSGTILNGQREFMGFENGDPFRSGWRLDMSLLFFSSGTHGAAQRIQWTIEAASQRETLEIYRSVEALSKRLHQPLNGLRVAVVSLSAEEELHDIIALKDLLADIATILILPDAGADTLAKAHQIRPRFLAYAESDPMVIAAVLAKMLRVYPGGPVPEGVKQNARSELYL
jgi:hypothetical protein